MNCKECGQDMMCVCYYEKTIADLEAENKKLCDMYHSASVDAFDESEKVDKLEAEVELKDKIIDILADEAYMSGRHMSKEFAKRWATIKAKEIK